MSNSVFDDFWRPSTAMVAAAVKAVSSAPIAITTRSSTNVKPGRLVNLLNRSLGKLRMVLILAAATGTKEGVGKVAQIVSPFGSDGICLVGVGCRPHGTAGQMPSGG